MKRLTSLIMFLLLGVSLFAVEGVLEVKKVMMDEEGKEYLEMAESVYPGDVMEYAYVITNNEDGRILSLEPVIPVPALTTLMPETIEPKSFMVSVDGSSYMKYPVLDQEGNPVPNMAYKKVKWMLGTMEPEAKVVPMMRVKVDE